MKKSRDERGAVGTIVGVLVGMGLVFGMLTVVVDVGGLLWERRQLQNASDAAALALAADCAKGAVCDPGDDPAVKDRLDALANANSNDGLSNIVSWCGVNLPTSAGFDPGEECPTLSYSDLSQCPNLPATLSAMSGLPYVEVRTESQSSSGNFVTNWFAGISGGANSSTDTVRACSRAAIGSPGSGSGDVPIAFSACDWRYATTGVDPAADPVPDPLPAPQYYTAPVYSPAWPYGYSDTGVGAPLWPQAAATPPAMNLGQEVILLTANPSNNNGNGNTNGAAICDDWNGHALPGGFGTLETEPSNSCRFVEYDHHWMHTSTGNNVDCNIDALVGKVISLPIFDCTAQNPGGAAPPIGTCTDGQGNGAFYHRAGFASFYLSGYQVNVTGGLPNKRKSLVSGQFPCSGGDRCISGWFVKGELAATSISGPPSGGGFFGTYAVVPAG